MRVFNFHLPSVKFITRACQHIDDFRGRTDYQITYLIAMFTQGILKGIRPIDKGANLAVSTWEHLLAPRVLLCRVLRILGVVV